MPEIKLSAKSTRLLKNFEDAFEAHITMMVGGMGGNTEDKYLKSREALMQHLSAIEQARAAQIKRCKPNLHKGEGDAL